MNKIRSNYNGLIGVFTILLLLTACGSGLGKPSAVGVWATAFSPDSSMLAAGYGGLGGGYDIRVWDTSQFRRNPLVLSGHTKNVKAVAFSPEGESLASAADDGTIRLWELSQPQKPPMVLMIEDDPPQISALAFDPHEPLLASGGSVNDAVRLWNVDVPDARPQLLPGNRYTGSELVFNSDGTMLVAAEHDTVRIWNLSTEKPSAIVLDPDVGIVHSIALSPDATLLAVSGTANVIRLWDMQELDTGSNLVATLAGHSRTVYSLAFHPDGQTLASGGGDGSVKLWNIQRPGDEPRNLRIGGTSIESVAFSPNMKWLASGSISGEVLVWDLGALDSDPISLQPN